MTDAVMRAEHLTPRGILAPAVEGVVHPRPFACDLTVGDGETSRAVDHVSNVHYLAWLDRAAELHSDSVGYTREAMLEQGVMWFVARHEIDYVAEAHPGDALTVYTWVRDMRRVKSWRDSIIHRPGDDTVVCRAATLWVLVDLATRRPTRVPPDMAGAFDSLEPPRHG